VTRGEGFLSIGDIASARLFYERAADSGNGSAALRQGARYDPGFLTRRDIRGIPGDPRQAASWCLPARDSQTSPSRTRLPAELGPEPGIAEVVLALRIIAAGELSEGGPDN
jgi:hypothetical protein